MKKDQFFESYLKKKVKFFESYLKKVHFFESYLKKFNSESHTKKGQFFESKIKVQFFESYKKKGSILWVFFFFLKRVSFFWKKFKNITEKMGSILWVILQEEEGSILLVTLKKKTILELQFKEGSILWVSKKTTQIEKVHKKGSILWVVYKAFNSLSHFSKRRFRFFESFFDTRFNSMNHIGEKRRGSIL